MNTRRIQQHGQSGSVLMTALIIGMVLGITLASYLLLMSHQNKMVVRGQAWNHALALAEAGVEDALAQLNRSFGTNIVRGGGENGWIGPSSEPATVTRPISSSCSYTATISSDGIPVITATGRVAVANSSKIIERQVRVVCTTKPAFVAAIVAKGGIDFKGNDVEVDSYDSADPNHSFLDMYTNAPGYPKAGGDVASTEGFINVGNGDIKGKLYTGPLNSGQYSVGPNGSVGDMAWNGPGVQPGWYFNDFNQDFTPVDPPYATGIPPTGTSNYFWVLGSYDYTYIGTISPKKTDTIYVPDNAHARLYVTGNFSMKGEIIIGTNASLKLYVGGTSAQMNTVNTVGKADSFQYYGLPTNEKITWKGNDAYVGTVYAPQAEMTLGGGGNNDFDFQGACVVNTLFMKGHFKFHFDEALRKGPVSGYVVSLWEEK